MIYLRRFIYLFLKGGGLAVNALNFIKDKGVVP